MSCMEFENLVALSVSGDLDAGEAARVRAHLSDCAACRALAEDLSGDLERLQSAHREPADRVMLQQVRASVMRRLESEQNRWRPFGGLPALAWRWQWVAVTAAVAFLIAGAAWWLRPHAEPRTEVADAPAAGRARPDAPRDTGRQPPAPTPNLPANPGDPDTGLAAARDPRSAITNNRESLDVPPGAASDPVGALRTQNEPSKPPPLPAQPLAAESGEALPQQLKAELFVVSAEEPDDPPVEGVRVRLPTSNPGIVVYWLMDENEKGD